MNTSPENHWIHDLVKEYEKPLCRYARSICGDDATARDAVQETFLRLCKTQPAKIKGHEAAWLFRVCRTRVLDLRKKDKPMTHLSDGHAAGLSDSAPPPDETSARRDSESHIPMNDFNPNDPKWTAYLLGELPSEEIQKIEEELDRNPEAKTFIAHLSGTESSLRNFFKEEPDLELDPLQKGNVIIAANQQKKSVPLRVWALPLAACLMIALAFPLLQPNKPEWKEVGVHPSQQFLDGEIETITEPREINELSEAEEVGERDAKNDFTMDMEVPEPVISKQAAPSIPPEPAPETESLSELMSDSSSPVLMKGVMVGRSNRARKAATDADTFSSSSGELSPRTWRSPSQDEFDVLNANTFKRVEDHPLSTFSIDVDTASYSVVRKMLKEGRLPPKDAVRIEEMVNYFSYDYAAPTDGSPFAAHMRVAPCPWAPGHQLLRIGLKGKEISAEERPALNLVYLLDVSGSMSGGNRLPLVKRAMNTLVSQLDDRDRVAVVVYAGAAGLVLPSTSGENDHAIREALDRLTAGGSTAGGAGIQLAYETARENFVQDGVNRVILCTDGDFNVGLNQTGDLEALIEKEAESGVQLTVLGFGMGNYKDDTLETLSNKGNGNYAYIDTYQEARNVLVDDLLGNMIILAKDVKIQIEFNPAVIGAYRLVGYENRLLKKEDFNNDKVDAGEIGAGHTVTALYELVPAGEPVPGDVPAVDELKYQNPTEPTAGDQAELLTLKLRHKLPHADTSTKTEIILPANVDDVAAPGEDFQFASAVASFGLWLRDSKFREEMDLQEILKLAVSGKGEDPFGYRAEFIQLIRSVEGL